MSTLALLFALMLPIALGAALLAACVRDGPAMRAPGMAPWLLGAGTLAGAFVLSLEMRALALAGVPFGIVSIAMPALAATFVFAWIAWRRTGDAWRGVLADAGDRLRSRDLERGMRFAWFALLAWIAVRGGMLLVETWTRPVYPWDAWSAWETKAKVYFATRTIVPFVDASTWAASSAPVWFDAAPGNPATLPLVQAWIATAMGAWDDARVGMPWWTTWVALVLVAYGEMRRRGASAIYALATAWLVGSLPLLGTQVALAGYADLPLAAAFTLGVVAGTRAIRSRDAVDVVAAVLGFAAVAMTKTSGWAWIVVAVPGFAVAALGAPWPRRIALGVAALAAGVIGVAARFTGLAIGPVSLAFDPAWDVLAADSLLLANWHLLVVGIVVTIAFAWRRLLAPALAPLTLVVATGAAWIALMATFPWFRRWGAETLGVNRAVLVIAPVALVWMSLAMREVLSPAAKPAVDAPQPA